MLVGIQNRVPPSYEANKALMGKALVGKAKANCGTVTPDNLANGTHAVGGNGV